MMRWFKSGELPRKYPESDIHQVSKTVKNWAIVMQKRVSSRTQSCSIRGCDLAKMIVEEDGRCAATGHRASLIPPSQQIPSGGQATIM
jgi:hypothetical protein